MEIRCTPRPDSTPSPDRWQANARLALDTIAMRPAGGFRLDSERHAMSHLEALSGNPPGSYPKERSGSTATFRSSPGLFH